MDNGIRHCEARSLRDRGYTLHHKYALAHARYAFGIGMCFIIFKNSFVK